jgi:hypothetical protein
LAELLVWTRPDRQEICPLAFYALYLDRVDFDEPKRVFIMNQKPVASIVLAAAFVTSVLLGGGAQAATESGATPVYDEAAYTAYVEKTMKKLDKLYLQFCGTCGVSGAKAEQARREYFQTARDLMQNMNARFDSLDPKKGAALSATEVLVNIHALTMLVDMLTATEMESRAENPHN